MISRLFSKLKSTPSNQSKRPILVKVACTMPIDPCSIHDLPLSHDLAGLSLGCFMVAMESWSKHRKISTQLLHCCLYVRRDFNERYIMEDTGSYPPHVTKPRQG
jgi:hypothetical protein